MPGSKSLSLFIKVLGKFKIAENGLFEIPLEHCVQMLFRVLCPEVIFCSVLLLET